MSRTLNPHDIQVLRSLVSGGKRHHDMSHLFRDNDKGFSYNLLKTLAQLKQAGLVDSLDKKDYIEWVITRYGKELI